MLALLAVVGALVALMWVALSIGHSYWVMRNIPGPGMLWFAQNLKSSPNIHQDLTRMLDDGHGKRRKVLLLWLLGRPLLNISSPELVKHVLRNPSMFDKWTMSPDSALSSQVASQGLPQLPTNEEWNAQRQLFNPAFHHSYLKNLIDVFMDTAQRTVAHMARAGSALDAKSYLQAFTLDVLGRALYSYDFHTLESRDSDILEAYRVFMREVFSPSRLIPYYDVVTASKPLCWLFPGSYEYKKAIETLTAMQRRLVAERRAESPTEAASRSKDLLDMMLEGMQSGTMSEKALEHNLFSFYIAGHDTTKQALEWELWYLAKHPDLQRRVYEEIVRVAGRGSSGSLSHEQLGQLDYLHRFISECLRIAPPAAFIPTRASAEATTLPDGTKVVKKTIISLGVYQLHHDPDYFEDPETFDPDRFLPERRRGRHPFSYIPFGAASRNCVGQAFSMLEQKAFITTLLQSHRLRLQDEDEVDVHLPLDKTMELMNSPAAVNIILEPRQ